MKVYLDKKNSLLFTLKPDFSKVDICIKLLPFELKQLEENFSKETITKVLEEKVNFELEFNVGLWKQYCDGFKENVI